MRLNRAHARPQMEADPSFLVHLLDELAQPGAQHTFERHPVATHDIHFEVAGSQRCGHLEPDEARADNDGATRCPSRPNDAARVSQRAQREDVRECRAFDRQANGLRARREQQRIVRESASAPEHDGLT